LQIACWKSAPALACGNSMIFKPSEETPLGALKLAEIFIDAGLPAGVFNVVQGGADIGQWLASHSEIEKISFTGEVDTGKKVMLSASENLQDVTMELGGKSPLIVFDDADIVEAVSAAMLGNFYTQGEICTNCTRVYLHQNISNEFLAQLKVRVENNINIGDPLDSKVNFGALISAKHQQQVLGLIAEGIAEGAELLTGGRALRPSSAPNGYFVEPTVFINCEDNMSIVQEEIFGPVM